MRYLIVGASAGLGRALAVSLAKHGDDLFLVASDRRDLEPLAAHLHLKYEVQAEFAECRLSASQSWLPALLEKVGAPETIDGLFFPIGVSTIEDTGMLAEAATRDIVEANFTGIVLLTSHFLPYFLARDSGVIVGFGSIASVRGRKANIVYSAAKRALLSYFESLKHLTCRTHIRVHLYQLGYLDTQQSFGKRLLFPKADPDRTAEVVWKNLRKASELHYLPSFWRVIAFVVRWLPWAFYKRLNF